MSGANERQLVCGRVNELLTEGNLVVYPQFTKLPSRTFNSAKSYNQTIRAEMCVNVPNLKNASEQSDAEGKSVLIEINQKFNNRISPKLIGQIFMASSEPLFEQISNNTLLLNQVINENWAKSTQKRKFSR